MGVSRIFVISPASKLRLAANALQSRAPRWGFRSEVSSASTLVSYELCVPVDSIHSVIIYT